MARKVLIIEATPKGEPLVTAVGTSQGLAIYTNPQLLLMHNAASGRDTRKFATRAKGLEQTWRAVKGFAAVDMRASPPVSYRDGDALPEGVEPLAPSGGNPDAQRLEPVVPGTTEEVTEQVIPASTPAGKPGRGRPITVVQKARKQADGTYVFAMEPRVPRGKTMGGRRPELVEMLRKRPTFKQLVQRYKPNGETDEQRAFNMATTVTCMCHVAGYGVKTASDGRIDLLEPLAA